MNQATKIKVTLCKGLMGVRGNHRLCVAALGLRYRGHAVEINDTSAVQGLLRKIQYLVRVDK